MALKRQPRGAGYKSFGSAILEEQYNELYELSLTRRETLATTIGLLLGKAIRAENGEPYNPESEGGAIREQAEPGYHA